MQLPGRTNQTEESIVDLQGDSRRDWIAGATNIHFEHLSTDDGLSSNITYSLWQDHLGFLWIGTFAGLNRYDGNEFKIYKHDPLDANSLSNNVIFKVYEDRRGELWVGTYGGGLNRFDRQNERFTRYQHDPNDPNSLGEDIIYSIYEDSTGVLWIATFGGGLDRYDRQYDRFIHYRHATDDPHSLSSDYVSLIFEDQSGELWIGTTAGLNQFDRETETFIRHQHDPENPHSLGNDVVVAIIEDQQGILWIGTQGGLDRLDRSTGYFTHYKYDPADPSSLSNDTINTLLEGPNGLLWIGTNGGGLNLFDRQEGRFTRNQHNLEDPSSLPDDFVNMLYQDQAGTVWIATMSRLSKYDLEIEKFQPFPIPSNKANSSPIEEIYLVYEDSSENLWVGASDGLRSIDPRTGEVILYQHDPENPESLSDNWIFTIHEDRSGVLWIGTGFSGIDRLDRQTGTFTNYQRALAGGITWSEDQISKIYEDRAGTMWFGTSAGLTRYDRGEDTFSHYFISTTQTDRRTKDAINTILEDQSGVLWIGTSSHGLQIFDRESNTFTPLPPDPAIPDYLRVGSILALHADTQGRLWIGTDGEGLFEYNDQENQYSHYSLASGLADNSVMNILEDQQGRLWLVTQAGVTRFDPKTGQFENFDVSDVQKRNLYIFTGIYRQNGQILLAGEQKLVSFWPDQIMPNPNKPPITLTAFRQGREALESIGAAELLQQATLVWPNNDFEFEFAALNFTHPEKNQYAYILDGYDEAWNYTGTRRFGRYTNLPAGMYSLRLKGSNNEGVWNEEGIAITITVVPPFWQTWWFQAVLALVLLGVAFTGYRLRVRNIESGRRELESQVVSRTKELAILNTIAGVASSSLELQEILHGALEKTLELMEIEAGGIYLLQDDNGILSIFAQISARENFIADLEYLNGETLSDQVLLIREPITVPDPSTEPLLGRWASRGKGFRSAAITPLIFRGDVMGSLFVITSGQQQFSQQDLKVLASIGGQICIAIENARLYEDERLRAEQFRVIAEVGRRLTLILDVDELLWQLVRTIQQAFGYYHVGIGMIEGDEVVYRFGAGELWDHPKFQFKPSRLRVGVEGISGWVAANGEPLLVPDVLQDPRYVWMQGSTTRSELAVPILVKGQVIGVMDAQSDRLNAFDETDLIVLQSLAHQAGAAIENAQLYEQSQQLAIMEERSRLARELHDAVTQTLFSASLISEALPAAWENNPKEGRELLQELRGLSRGALAEMRTLLLELRPAALAETSLEDLLRQLGEAASGREGIPVKTIFEGQGTLPPDVHIALYRITQEAINNIVKHARANQILVRLCYSCVENSDPGQEISSSVTLSVSDDGRGFDPARVPHHRLGLGIMHERAQAIGASLTIESQPGEGTQITVLWEQSRSKEAK